MKPILFAAILLLSSCAATKEIPIKGIYPPTPMMFNSKSPFEKVWDNLVDLFAQKGLSIRIIDKSSGLIISQNSVLSCSMENKEGKLVDPDAFIVVPSIKANGRIEPITGTSVGPYATEKQLKAIPVYGDWNVRIKSNGSGTSINVNITDVYYETIGSGKVKVPIKLSGYKSTGTFEIELFNLIK